MIYYTDEVIKTDKFKTEEDHFKFVEKKFREIFTKVHDEH